MFKIGILVLGLTASVAFSYHCKDISGFWQNELGSNMTIILRPGNSFTGEYSTAVESKRGAALITSNITGTLAPLDDGALFAFTVLFNHGKSLTTWVGQCMVCEGEEILFTTWTLRSYLPKPTDKWMSNHINQDTFKRVNDRYNNIPRHLRIEGPSQKDERSLNCEKNLKAGMGGHWVSESSDAVKFIDCTESGIVSGSYHNSPLIGQTAGGGFFTALGYVSTSSEQVKGWTGHIYENSRERERKLETNWLTHSFSDNCKTPRSLVRYGTDNYMFTLNHKEPGDAESFARKVYNSLWAYFF